jgi:hypothetical protein
MPYLSCELSLVGQSVAVGDVVLEVFDELSIWIVGHDNLLGSAEGAYDAGQTGACTELEHTFALDDLICALL